MAGGDHQQIQHFSITGYHIKIKGNLKKQTGIVIKTMPLTQLSAAYKKQEISQNISN